MAADAVLDPPAESTGNATAKASILQEATALAKSMGGRMPLAMLALEPKVLEHGRELMDKAGSMTSLKTLLEDSLKDAGEHAGLRIEDSSPFLMVVLDSEDSGGGPSRIVHIASESPARQGDELGKRRSENRRASSLSPERKRSRDVSWGRSSTWNSGDQRGRSEHASRSKSRSTDQGSRWNDWNGWSDWSDRWDSGYQGRWSDRDWDDRGSDGDNESRGKAPWWRGGSIKEDDAQRGGSSRKKAKAHTSEDAGKSKVASSSTKGDKAILEGDKVIIEGLEVQVVLGVPIVSIVKGSDFDGTAAWMLQCSLDNRAKAESLFEACDADPQAKKVIAAALKKNIVQRKDEIGIVRQRGDQYPPCLAAGLQGKRSMMLALSLALCAEHSECFDRCMQELKVLGIHEKFRRLMEACEKLMASGKK